MRLLAFLAVLLLAPALAAVAVVLVPSCGVDVWPAPDDSREARRQAQIRGIRAQLENPPSGTTAESEAGLRARLAELGAGD